MRTVHIFQKYQVQEYLKRSTEKFVIRIAMHKTYIKYILQFKFRLISYSFISVLIKIVQFILVFFYYYNFVIKKFPISLLILQCAIPSELQTAGTYWLFHVFLKLHPLDWLSPWNVRRYDIVMKRFQFYLIEVFRRRNMITFVRPFKVFVLIDSLIIN